MLRRLQINKITDENRYVVSAEGILPNQMASYIDDVKRLVYQFFQYDYTFINGC